MDNQLELFSQAQVYPDMCELFKKIENQYNFPNGTISLNENISQKGINKGNLISVDLCVNEPEYPKSEKTHFIKSSLVMKFAPTTNGYELLVPKNVFSNITFPTDATSIVEKESDIYIHVLFPLNSTCILSYIEKNIIYCIDNYSSASSFGCCSQYKECSDQKMCLHPNKLYAKGCQYRKNLEAGKIFY